MIRPLVLPLLAALALSGCGGDSTGKLIPVLDLQSAAVDFGHVAIGGTGVQELLVHNDGNTTLRLESVTTQAPFSVEAVPEPLAPGETRPIVLAFQPPEEGPASGTLTVRTNDPDAPESVLDLTGVGVVALVEVDPPSLDFGEVYWALRSPTVFQRITVSNSGTGAFEVRSATLTDDAGGVYRIQADEVTGTLAPGDAREIELGCLPAGLGPVSGTLTLETDAPAFGDVAVPLQATGVGPTVEVCTLPPGAAEPTCTLPAALPFGASPIDVATTGEVWVRNTGTRDLTLKEARKGGSDAFSLTPVAAECVPDPEADPGVVATIAPGAVCTLLVDYTPGDYTAHAGLVTLRTDDRIRPDVQVSLSGHVLRPDVEARPMGITMGSSGNSTCYEEETIELLNCGDQDLVIADVPPADGKPAAAGLELVPKDEDGVTGPDRWPAPDTLYLLDAPALPLTLPGLGPDACAEADAQAYVTVAFAPKINGVWEGQLRVRSNDPVTPDLAVNILAQKSAIGSGCQE